MTAAVILCSLCLLAFVAALAVAGAIYEARRSRRMRVVTEPLANVIGDGTGWPPKQARWPESRDPEIEPRAL